MKKYLLFVAMFTAVLTECMNLPIKKIKARKKLLPAAPLLIKEIVDLKIKPQLSLQDTSRFKRTCKPYNQMIDMEEIDFKAFPYDVKTRVLAHYKTIENKEKFDLLYKENEAIRREEKQIFHDWSCIKYKKYRTAKNVNKERLRQLELALQWGKEEALNLLKIILKGSTFNIFDSSYRKKMVRRGCDCFTLRSLLSQICYCMDQDLLLVAVGGIIEPRALKYIFHYSQRSLIDDLKKRNAFIEQVPDKKGKDFSCYLRNHVPPL